MTLFNSLIRGEETRLSGRSHEIFLLIIKFGFHFENLVGRMVQDGSPSNQKELLRLNFGIRVFLIAVITIESFISCCISIFSLFVSGWSKVNI